MRERHPIASRCPARPGMRALLIAGISSMLALAPTPAAASVPEVIMPPTKMRTGTVGNTEQLVAHAAVFDAAMMIERLHSCARVTTSEDIRDLVAFQKQRSLLGYDDAGAIEEIAAAMGARYMLTSTLARIGRGFSVAFTLVDTRTNRILARTTVDVAEDQFPAVTRRAMKQVVDAIPACRLSMDIAISVAGTAGGGRGGGAFAGVVDLEADDGGRISGKGAVAGGMVMDDAPAEIREDVTVAFQVPFGVTGTRDEDNVAHLRTTGGMASFSALQGKVSGGAASGGGGDIRIPWRAGKRVVVRSSTSGGVAVTTFTLRRRS